MDGTTPEHELGQIADALVNGEDERARLERTVRETRQHVLEQLRDEDGDPDLADRIEKGETLNDADQATVDAIIYGTGILVDDKRVSPTRVKLIQWQGP